MITSGKPVRFEKKVCLPSELAERAAQLKGPLVFTNGVFDLLHRGHVTYLDQAAQEGQNLIVVVNSDASVKRLGKGPDRPINSQTDRMYVLAALECVSLISYFEEDTPLNAILAVRPNILIKGGDWALDKIVGAKEVQSWGGTVLSIAFEHKRSTTETLKKIRQQI
jgi:rfaE bifunctional protein nucleotidyltransferase chain/domain